MPRLNLWMLLACLLAIDVQAAYVTDQLLVGLYEQRDAGGTPLQLLKSGTPLEVIEADGDFTRVRTAGGAEGWLETAYLTDQRPAQHMLLTLRARVAELEQAAGDSPAPDQRVPDESLVRLETELQQTRQQLAEIQAWAVTETYHRTWPWVVAGLALLLGFAAGIGLVEHRLRKCRRER